MHKACPKAPVKVMTMNELEKQQGDILIIYY